MVTITEQCGGRLEQASVVALAEQMVARLEAFHSKGFLHRDVKPDNFAVGRGAHNNIVYIIDYGLVKRFRNAKTKVHIGFRQNKRLAGTARYASINTHMGFEQSRRDDLEGLGYTFVYMTKGKLPWQGIKADTKQERYELIMNAKRSIPVEALCKRMPAEFVKYLYYCRDLGFEDEPNYQLLKEMFRNCFYKCKFNKEFAFTWVKQRVDLSSYRQKDSNPNACHINNQSHSSNKAECDNEKEALMRAKSKQIDRNALEAQGCPRFFPNDQVQGKKPSKLLLDPKDIAKNNFVSQNSCKNASNDKLTLHRYKEKATEDLPFKIEPIKQRRAEIDKLIKGMPRIVIKEKGQVILKDIYKEEDNVKKVIKGEQEFRNHELNKDNIVDEDKVEEKSEKNVQEALIASKKNIVKPFYDCKEAVIDLKLNNKKNCGTVKNANKFSDCTSCDFEPREMLEKQEMLCTLARNRRRHDPHRKPFEHQDNGAFPNSVHRECDSLEEVQIQHVTQHQARLQEPVSEHFQALRNQTPVHR
eukprot:TRINITY_DN4521_c0_g1_i9.p1 TRINITY_DN4521_c0_g1~~TRINITY_DN4521_c0_g1_i9.p1  ORF type:complete len:528 (-),score=87.14 TRINITY_DN4521_c0_g1_i9:169-1752(-)